MEKKTYNLKKINLVESNFKREFEADFDTTIVNSLSINIENAVNEDIVIIRLKVSVNGKDDENNILFNFDVTYLGEWEIGDVEILPIEHFSKINAPAMLFPFVRETIASLSLKAGLEPLLLPTINFHKEASKS